MKKNSSIQGLRGLFAIGVLLSHCAFTEGYSIWTIIRSLSNVSFFFMISGYFLYLTSNKSLSMVHFLRKKLIKIYPLHFCMFMLMVLVKLITKTFNLSLKNYLTVFLHLMLMQTWVPDIEIATAYNTVSWFLSSLLFCYIVGYLILHIKDNYHAKNLGIIVRRVIILVFLTLKIIVAVIIPNGNDWGYYLTYLCPLATLPDFLLGFEIADCCYSIKLDEKKLTVFQIFAIVFMIIMFSTKHFLPSNYTRAFYCIPFNIVLIISVIQETEFSKIFLGNRFLLFLGSISFEIYLIHDILITAFNKYFQIIPRLCAIHPLLAVVFVICISIITAYIFQKALTLLYNLKSKR